MTKYCHNWSYPGSGGVNATVRKLPPRVFLISGDRAGPAIPSNPFGGPCYLGKLAIFGPSMREMLNQTIWRAGHSKRTKRAKTSLGSNCNDRVEFWSTPAQIMASFLTQVLWLLKLRLQ